MRFVVPLGLALVLAATPVAAENSMDVDADMTLSSDFTRLTMHAEIGLTGDLPLFLRGLVDSTFAGGNGDGTVSQAEADQFQQRGTEDVAQDAVDDVTGNMTLDGNRPVSSDVGSMAIDQLVGPVDGRLMTMTIDGSMILKPDAGPTHALVFRGDVAGPDDDQDDEATVTGALEIRAPDGHIVSSFSGIPGASLNAGKDVLTIPANAMVERAPGDGTVVFAPDPASSPDASPIPAPVAPLLAVGLLAVAAVARRAR